VCLATIYFQYSLQSLINPILIKIHSPVGIIILSLENWRKILLNSSQSLPIALLFTHKFRLEKVHSLFCNCWYYQKSQSPHTIWYKFMTNPEFWASWPFGVIAQALVRMLRAAQWNTTDQKSHSKSVGCGLRAKSCWLGIHNFWGESDTTTPKFSSHWPNFSSIYLYMSFFFYSYWHSI